MKIAGLVQESIVDGPGLRFVVFTQGCSIRCEGCHNPDTWDSGGGTEMSLAEIIGEMLSDPLTDGLTLSGGEPFEQAADCACLAAAAHENGLNVWTFTGKTFEELLAEEINDEDVKLLLEQTDVLVDGRFDITERTLTKKWCGSKNQRVIKVRESLSSGKVIMIW
ncbi:MAG: anaerobic ribonucleoside-triphosphate reductase activating protein [Oscillospiraceae bacterium]|nr:anaerobic ribonucleoside-triphosphate reductase activating protein [Oscillospiraceae bacterium]